MIVVYHKSNKIVKVVRDGEDIVSPSATIASVLLRFSQSFPQDWLVWCHWDLKSHLDLSNFESIFHHHKIMASYTNGTRNYIPDAIGYVEESPFINVNKKVSYPTWLMSSDAGGIHASVLNSLGSKIKPEANFEYFLNSVSKSGMPEGLFCYSEPRLLKHNSKEIQRKLANDYSLFRFVKQHYKKRWLLLLFLNLFLFEKRFPILPLGYTLFFKSRKKIKLNLDVVKVHSTLKITDKKTIDVIIPTIGRKKYLYDVLQDLAKQTHLPEKVIIVEQNPLKESNSELDYLTTETWPFTIKHIFTHQAGACNARNIALAEVENEWVFMNDDDNRFDKDLIEKFFEKTIQYGAEVITTVYLQPKEHQNYNTIHQTGIFGSGNSFVKTASLAAVSFDKALEFGYGEDTDFGLQLRNQGFDVIYFPDLRITHLKAPMGGFRIKIKKQWEDDLIQPKPSPTVMLYKILNLTKQQINGYRTVLFFKYYSKQIIKNPLNYLISFRKQWDKSVFWATKLKKQL